MNRDSKTPERDTPGGWKSEPDTVEQRDRPRSTDERVVDREGDESTSLPPAEREDADRGPDRGDDVIARSHDERHETPRRYETDDPALPADDASLNTKI